MEDGEAIGEISQDWPMSDAEGSDVANTAADYSC